MDGGEIQTKEGTVFFDRTLCIFLGAFEYDEVRYPKKEIRKHIGFGVELAESKGEYKEELTMYDLYSYCKNWQFVSRTIAIVNLRNEIGDSVYKKIISGTEDEIKKIYGAIADNFFLTKDDYEDIIIEAKERDGLRVVRQMVWNRFLNSRYYLGAKAVSGSCVKTNVDEIIEKELFLAN